MSLSSSISLTTDVLTGTSVAFLGGPRSVHSAGATRFELPVPPARSRSALTTPRGWVAARPGYTPAPMLRIRPEQFEVFEERARASFDWALARHVREHYPDRCADQDDEALVERVRTLRLRAEGHGILRRSDLCGWVNLAMEFGDRFDEDEDWAKSILERPGVASGATRMLLLDEHADQLLDQEEAEPEAAR